MRSILALATALATGLAAPLAAQAPKPAAPAAPRPSALPGLSPQGNAIIAKFQGQEDPQAKDAIAKLRVLIPQLSQIAQTSPVDVEKFSTLLRQQDALAAQIKSRGTERIIAVLKQLPPADRSAFLKAIGQRQGGGAPAGPGR